MIKFLATCVLSVHFITAIGQNIRPDKTVLDFDVQQIGEMDSVQLPIHLGNNESVQVSARIFGKGFSIKKSNYRLKRGGDTSIWVYFKPAQNVGYDGELFVSAKGLWNQRIDLKGKGDLGIAYYKATFNLWDKELLDQLKKITSSGQRSLGYTGARDKMYGSIDNVGGKVTCAYTAREASFNSRAGANNSSFNCEHTWPQSKFCSSETAVMKADIHHLFATDVNSNSQRGSKPFGVVSGSGSWNEGGSKTNSSTFEPRDAQKGATARAMLYMATRYGNCSGFLGGQEGILRTWALENEPSAFEKGRNTAIFNEQKNRNPFVDAPVLISRVHSFTNRSNRTRSAAAVLVDTLIVGTKNAAGDSAVFKVYVVNTGDAAFEIADVTTNLAYVSSSTLVSPGESAIYRFASKFPLKEGEKATFSFKNEGLSSQEVTFDASVGIEKTSRVSYPLAWFDNRGTVRLYPTESTEPVLLEVYGISGALVFSRETFTNINLLAVLPKGVYLLRLNRESEGTLIKAILR